MVDLFVDRTHDLAQRPRHRQEVKVEKDDYLARLLQVTVAPDDFDDDEGRRYVDDNDQRRLMVLQSAISLLQAGGLDDDGTQDVLDILSRVFDLPSDRRQQLKALAADAEDPFIADRVSQILDVLDDQSDDHEIDRVTALLDKAEGLDWTALLKQAKDVSALNIDAGELGWAAGELLSDWMPNPKSLFMLHVLARNADFDLESHGFMGSQTRTVLEGYRAIDPILAGTHTDHGMMAIIMRLSWDSSPQSVRDLLVTTLVDSGLGPKEINSHSTKRLLRWITDLPEDTAPDVRQKYAALQDLLVGPKALSMSEAVAVDGQLRTNGALSVRYEGVAYANRSPTFRPVIREPDWRPGDVAQVLGGPEVRIQKVMTGPDGAAGVEVMIGRPDPSAISDAPTFAIVPASVLYRPHEVGVGSVVRVLGGPRPRIGVVVAAMEGLFDVHLENGRRIDVTPDRVADAGDWANIDRAGGRTQTINAARAGVMRDLSYHGMRWPPALSSTT